MMLVTADIREAIESDLASIDAEVEILATGLLELGRETTDGLLVQFNAMGLAAAIDSIYSGSERVMSLVAAKIDDAPIAKSGAWHAELIERLASPHGQRAAILSPDTRALLDVFRSFRHRVRSNYGSRLDVPIVEERARAVPDLARLFRQDLQAFLDSQA